MFSALAGSLYCPLAGPPSSHWSGCFLQRLRPGSLRYPGGEKANSYLWAPPPFTAEHSRPLLTSEAGWPASAPALYNLSAHDYAAPPLDFEGFMRLVDATGAEPYIVLNLAGKSNMEPADSVRFNSSVLKAVCSAPPLLRSTPQRCKRACKAPDQTCSGLKNHQTRAS